MLKPQIRALFSTALVLATIVFSAVVSPHVALAHEPVCLKQDGKQACPDADKREAAMLAWLDKYHLSDEQKSALMRFRNGSRSQLMLLHDEAHQKKEALDSYLEQPNATQEEALNLQKQVNEVKQRMADAKILLHFEFRRLAPEAMLADLKAIDVAWKKKQDAKFKANGHLNKNSAHKMGRPMKPEDFFVGDTYKPEMEWLAVKH